MKTPHPKVKSPHLSRKSYLYVRQSSPQQVIENVESRDRQYALKDQALALGWERDQIVVIDSELGQSAAGYNDRAGFQRLVADVGLGKVGIVMGLEVSRLARNSADWHRLIQICSVTDTLVLDESGIYDPSCFNDKLLLGIKGNMAEAELHSIMDRLHGGLINKAKRNALEIPIPTGFVYNESGNVMLDQDQQVQEAIRLFFKTFRRTGSSNATVVYFNKNKIQFPLRIRTGAKKGELHWGMLRGSHALRILHNPRYAGAYAFGKTRTTKALDGKLRCQRLPAEEWLVFSEGVHDGYITLDEYNENQKRLRINARALGVEHRSPPREGPSLLQGLAICGKCGRRMTVRYHVRHGEKVPDYVCQQTAIEFGEPMCQSIHGFNIDRRIGELLVEIVTPTAINVALSIQKELENRQVEVDRLRQREVERVAYEAELAKNRFFRVDPNNRLVADNLEADWNDKLRTLEQAHEYYEQQKKLDANQLGQWERDDIINLTNDFGKIWNSPKTEHKERKRIVRLIVEDITLTRIDDEVEAKIRFKGGSSKTERIALPLKAWIKQKTSDEIVRMIDGLLEHHTESQIADILNEKGRTTGRGHTFKNWTILRLVRQHKLLSAWDRLRLQGKLTAEEVSQKYDVSLSVIRRWKDKGVLTSHLLCGNRRLLFDDPGDFQPVMVKGVWVKNPASNM